VDKTKEIIGEDNITEYIEPSAGAGVFLDYLDKPYLAYDIEPEDNRIKKQNFLELNLEYKKGRCVIGNPPYGEFNLLSEKFYKKSIQICDYISFIQPISQYKNNIKLYEFDLIYSEDLGKRVYTDREIHCCLNIYRRPINGKINKKQNYKLKDVSITRLDRGSKTVINEYDINICSYGASIGKIPEYIGQYSQELYIKIHNNKYKEQIKFLIINTNWKEIIEMTATPKLQIWRVYKYIKEKIPEIS
jgi:hypothetical protein